jgi:hypothetical protein
LNCLNAEFFMREKTKPSRALPNPKNFLVAFAYWELLKPNIPILSPNEQFNSNKESSFEPTATLFETLSFDSETDENDLLLTDLQKHIIRIFREYNGSVHIGTLTNEIQKIWTTIRKRDGSKYTTDCRRAVSATLANNNNVVDPLFVKVLDQDGIWALGPRVEAIPLDKLTVKNPIPDLKRKLSESDNEKSDESTSKRRRIDFELVQSDSFGSNSPSPKPLSSSKPEHDNELTELQVLMIRSIQAHNGSASLDAIYRTVLKQWGTLKRKDGSYYLSDCKKAVKSSLSYIGGSSPIFKKDLNVEGNWIVTPEGLALLRAKTVESPENTPKVTELHEMLMRIIVNHGGKCTFEQIFHDVINNKNYRGLRANGAPADSKRAIVASLSHNPPGNFKKNKEGFWIIAPKARALAEQLTGITLPQ